MAVSSALRDPGVPALASPARQAIAYVANMDSGTVTPIRTATNTALPPVKAVDYPEAIAITTPSKSPRALRHRT